jgi:hypothetical protein
MQATAAASRPGSSSRVTHHTDRQGAERYVGVGSASARACLCPYRLGAEITSDNDVASEAEYDSMDERVQ